MKLLFLSLLIFSFSAFAGNVSSLSYSGTNVTTAAYVTLVASTAIPSNNLVLCDSSTQLLKLATGATSAEVDLTSEPISGCVNIHFGFTIPAGTRLSLRAISATASTGFNSVSFLP